MSNSESSFIISKKKGKDLGFASGGKRKGERSRLFLKRLALNGRICAEIDWDSQPVHKPKNPHEVSDMRPICFSNWKIRGVCVDECPHTEACMEASLAALPTEVRRLVSKFEPRLQLDNREKSLAWERRLKKLKK